MIFKSGPFHDYKIKKLILTNKTRTVFLNITLIIAYFSFTFFIIQHAMFYKNLQPGKKP